MQTTLIIAILGILNMAPTLAQDVTTQVDANTYYADPSSVAPPTLQDIESGNLTDNQKLLMENYVHDGHQQRQYEELSEEECENAGYSEAKCASILTGGDATKGEKGGLLNLSSTEMQALAQVYTLIIGTSGIGNKNTFNSKKVPTQDQIDKMSNGPEKEKFQNARTAQNDIDKNNGIADGGDGKLSDEELKNKQKTANEGKKDTKEEKEDYCRFIAMGTEVIAQFQTQAETDFILSEENSTESAQVQTLRKQLRTHKARERVVGLQTTGWLATVACYTAYMVTGGVAGATPGWDIAAKTAGSLLLWDYFNDEKSHHKKAQSVVNSLITQLGAETNNCNPISQRDCYCSQDETQYDTQYCLPQIRARAAIGQYQLSCLDSNLQEDATCACAQTGSCADKKLKGSLGQIHIPGFQTNALENFSNLANGEIPINTITSGLDASSSKLFAFSKGKLRDLDTSNIESSSLNDDEKAVALYLSNKGFPKAVAGNLAGNRKLAAASKNNVKKLSSNRLRRYRSTKNSARSRKSSRVASYSGGKGINKKAKSTRSKNDLNSFMNRFKNKKTKTRTANNDILKFAERASQSADINKNKDTDIFKIISHRYKMSAQRRLLD